jgi:hypothetical protein
MRGATAGEDPAVIDWSSAAMLLRIQVGVSCALELLAATREGLRPARFAIQDDCTSTTRFHIWTRSEEQPAARYAATRRFR